VFATGSVTGADPLVVSPGSVSPGSGSPTTAVAQMTLLAHVARFVHEGEEACVYVRWATKSEGVQHVAT